MKIIDQIVQSGSNVFKSIRTDNKKQLAELERLEKQIEDLQAKEQNVQDLQPSITNRNMLKFRLIGLFTIFLAYISYQSLDIMYLILTAFIVSLAMEAIVDFLERTLRYRVIAIVISYVLLIVLVLSGLFFIVPFLLSELSQVLTIMTANVSHIQQVLQTTPLLDIVQQTHRIPKDAKEVLLNRFSDPTVVAGVQAKLQANMSQLISMGTSYARDI